jgi:mono/diheme cytochrome c family protein
MLLFGAETTVEEQTESFISHYEYGEMLYNSPRGVSCSECHGKLGEGKIIIQYKDIHGKEPIKGVDIRQKSLAEMIDSVARYHKVMPRYYLTDDEVGAIYDYLQKKNEVYLNSIN